MPPVYIPGLNQQTAATLQIIRQGMGAQKSRSTSRKKRRSSTKSATKPAKRRKTRTSKKAARLVKGSAAAKRYMAKIRKKRK